MKDQPEHLVWVERPNNYVCSDWVKARADMNAAGVWLIRLQVNEDFTFLTEWNVDEVIEILKKAKADAVELNKKR